MKRKGHKWVFLFFFLWRGFICHASAEESSSISVRAILPENQYDTKKTYFDLMIGHGEKQTIQIEIENHKKEEVEIEAFIHSAYTNEKGTVQYEDTEAAPDPTLRYEMQDIVEVPEKVKIPAEETYILNLDIQMPAEEFDGILAGGITIGMIEDSVDEEETKEEKTMELVNEFSYVIGIVLRNNENKAEPEVNLRYVNTDNTGENTVVRANVQNEASVFIENVVIEARIRGKGDKETIYEVKEENYKIAPNSNFDFIMNTGEKRLEGGTYTLYFSVTSGSKSWNWKENFVIKEKGITEEEVEMKSPRWIYIVIAIVVAVSAAGGLLLGNRRLRYHFR